MTLGEKIQELRRRSGMSQDTLAEVLDVSRQAVSKWERDEAMPETDKIIRIAKVFSVSTDYLLLEEPPQPTPGPAPQPHTHRPSIGDRMERFIRRHGYKAGYVMMAIGAAMCAVAILVLCLVPGFGSGMFGIFDGVTDSYEDVLYDSGFGYTSSAFGGMFNIVDQQVDKMESAWSGAVTIISLLFCVPVGIGGIALITLGIVIVIKGRKLALQTP